MERFCTAWPKLLLKRWKSRNFCENLFFPAASEVQVLDGPAVLDRELQSRHWGGDLFISMLLLDLLHPSLRALCLVVKSKGRGQGESVNTSCNKTRRKKVQGGVCQGGMFFENRGQWLSRLCWWARGWSTPPPAQDWQMQVLRTGCRWGVSFLQSCISNHHD